MFIKLWVFTLFILCYFVLVVVVYSSRLYFYFDYNFLSKIILISVFNCMMLQLFVIFNCAFFTNSLLLYKAFYLYNGISFKRLYILYFFNCFSVGYFIFTRSFYNYVNSGVTLNS